MFIVVIALPLYFIIENKFAPKFIGFGYGLVLDDMVLIILLPYIPYDSINSVYMETLPFTIFFLVFFTTIFLWSFIRKKEWDRMYHPPDEK
jgi:hypothetical protein